MECTASPDSVQASRGKKVAASHAATPSHTTPTTFFLRTEADMIKNQQQRGRRKSRSSTSTIQNTSMGSSFGVESLEETIGSAFGDSESSQSRTTSTSSDVASDAGSPLLSAEKGTLRSTRRAANRVHPTILATGRRIISSEGRHERSQDSSGASPVSLPPTPIKFSPYTQSAAPSTPRSGSPKSLRSSDEESVYDDHSQAVSSTSGHEVDQSLQKTPQLVMPSLAMPARRPFTEQGRHLGRAKIMVVGPKGVGKTSFINCLLRSTEHIVHVDQLPPSTTYFSFNTEDAHYRPTSSFTEIQASTRPYPAWWTDIESKPSRRNSIVTGVLERNITLIDTPGLETEEDSQRILNHVKSSMARTANTEHMSDTELLSLLSGDGGAQIDAIIYLFDPALFGDADSTPPSGAGSAHSELLQYLCRYTNLIPVIGKADLVKTEELPARKQQILQAFDALEASPYRFHEHGQADGPAEPLAVSSALGDDTDVIDASILMSSQYVQPLIPSELGTLSESLFTAVNMARMRHVCASKFIYWRRENMGSVEAHKQTLLQSPPLRSDSPGGMTSNGSFFGDPSKVLVPYSASSYYRSDSPAATDTSALSRDFVATSNVAFATHNEQSQPSEPFRQIRLAKWAQDLQRGLESERRKYRQMYDVRLPKEWCKSEGSDRDDRQQQALTVAKDDGAITRPARGRLGGDLGVVDPRDPLGILAFGQAFRRSGFFALQILSGCSLIGAVAYWAVKNWIELQDFFFASSGAMVQSVAIPAPARGGQSWLDHGSIRSFFGW